MRILEEIVEDETEKIIKASDFFSLPESEIFKQRSLLEEAYQADKKLWVCPVFRDFIKIRGRSGGIVSLHFYHIPSSKFCPLKDERKLSKEDILKYKFNGQKEGSRHRYLKQLLTKQLNKDNRFSDIRVEKRIKGASKKWRKPDVSAVYKNKRIVFEIQLSTTFLSVIKERNNFYKENNIYILWLFDRQRASVEDMRFSENDIFFPNHHNAFFVDETLKGNNLQLICAYENAFLKNYKIETKYNLTKIDFDKLNLSKKYNVFYHDYDIEYERLEKLIERTLIDEFIFELKELNDLYEFQNVANIEKYNSVLKKYDVDLSDGYFLRFLSSILSLKYKKVVGYKFKKIVQVLHKYFDIDINSDFHMGKYIFEAIKNYGVREIIIAEDRTGKFIEKVKVYQKMNFSTCSKYDKVIKLLFPELI
jgi:competence CoiA-like predicted nuclease